MAQTIQARIGDNVRANFNLVFKNAEVNKLSDKEQFSDIGFMMECNRQSPRQALSIAVAGSQTTGRIRCRRQGPIADDEPIEVEFFFDDAEQFRVNDLWKLAFVYRGGGADFPGGDDPHPRKHPLGLVQLVG